MTITLDEYDFDGPYKDLSKLKEESGVYAIFYPVQDGYRTIDIGESKGVRGRVEDHDRKDCWDEKRDGKPLYYGAFYANEKDRKEIEASLRNNRNGRLCGER